MIPKLTVLRHTFEEVIKSQKEIRNFVDDLAVENRGLHDRDERDKFIVLLARATYGLGHRFEFKVKFKDGKEMVFFHADAFFTAMAYHDGNSLTDDRNAVFDVEIGELWRTFRRFALRVFPVAQDHAATMSPERIPADEFRHKYVGTQKPYDYQAPETIVRGPEE